MIILAESGVNDELGYPLIFLPFYLLQYPLQGRMVLLAHIARMSGMRWERYFRQRYIRLLNWHRAGFARDCTVVIYIEDS